jgi:hypothetical protein
LRYLVTCAALGVAPVTRERAAELVAEWSAAIDGATIEGDTLH